MDMKIDIGDWDDTLICPYCDRINEWSGDDIQFCEWCNEMFAISVSTITTYKTGKVGAAILSER